MMLRKRTRSHQKDQEMSDSGSDSHFSQSDVLGHNSYKHNSFFTNPGLFVGLNNKTLSDSDSVRSPTSPLDFKFFTSLANPFVRPFTNGQHKNWGTDKVGLSIVDSLDNDMRQSGKFIRSPDKSKNILFGPGMRTKNPKLQTHFDSFQAQTQAPNSLPKDYPVFPRTLIKSPFQKDETTVIFEISDDPLEPEPFGKTRPCSLDSCISLGVHKTNLSRFENNSKTILSSKLNPLLGSGGSSNNGVPFMELVSETELELSEDYTCVITRGPNPKTTHIFGDRVLESHDIDLSRGIGNNGGKQPAMLLNPGVTKSATMYPSDNFLSFCYSCNKALEEGKDVYIYRGEKAFCSLDCRSLEIMMDEELEEEAKSNSTPENSPKSNDNNNSPELFEPGIVFTT